MLPLFTIGRSRRPMLMTAIHAGHELRAEVAAEIGLDDATRLREEDPFTDRLLVSGVPLVVHRSRFEVDLNRPRDGAVYTTPDTAWGLEVWRRPPPDALVQRSLASYDEFYDATSELLDDMARRGPFLVLDVHSYNHRRSAEKEPAPAADNPEVNVGTGSVDRDRWGTVVDRFLESLSAEWVAGHALDVRENVKFRGGEFSRWVNERYDGIGVALAVEFKKVFMDEWTGNLDEVHLDELARALAAVIPATLDELTGSVV
jgi:N-formylglutamate amidohydrolase